MIMSPLDCMDVGLSVSPSPDVGGHSTPSTYTEAMLEYLILRDSQEKLCEG